MSQILAKWVSKDAQSLEDASGLLQVKLAPVNALERTVDGLVVKASGIVTEMVADANITEAKLANTFIRADGVNTFTANQSLGGFLITDVAAPVSGTDAANKNYVDAKAAGLTWKDATVAATTGNITLSGLLSVDGVQTVAGDRVLVRAQTDASQNGIYVVASGSWTRSVDLNDATPVNEFRGAAVWVEAGTTWGATGWAQNNSQFAAVDTDAVNWVQFNGATSITAGNGISKVGNTLDVNVDGASLEISVDALQIKDLGVVTAKIDDVAVTAAKINADVAGEGLSKALDGSLAVNVDASTIEIVADTLQVVNQGIVTAKIADSNVTTIKIADDAVTAAKINSDVAGNGLVQALDGSLEVFVDDTTIEITADSLNVKDLGISKAKINADVAGNGLGKALDGSLEVLVDGTSIEIVADTLRVVDLSVTAAKVNADVAGEGLSKNGVTGALDVNVGNGLDIISDVVELTALTTSWDLGGSAGVTVTNVPAPVNSSDVVNKGYVDTLAANISSRTTQAFTISNADIANGYVTLAAAPQTAAQVYLFVKGAPFQLYGDDYAMDASAADRLTWVGYGLETLLQAGDKITIEFDV